MSTLDSLERFRIKLDELDRKQSASAVLGYVHNLVVNIAGVEHADFDAVIYEAFDALLARAHRKLRLAARAEAEATLAELKEEA